MGVNKYKYMKDFKILASEITEMLSCEWGHCSDKEIEKHSVEILGDLYITNHYCSSRCCFKPSFIWKKYKGGYKNWYGLRKYNYWDKRIKLNNRQT